MKNEMNVKIIIKTCSHRMIRPFINSCQFIRITTLCNLSRIRQVPMKSNAHFVACQWSTIQTRMETQIRLNACFRK